MIDYIDVPLPYIIGVPRQIWLNIGKQRKLIGLPQDVVIYDVDLKTFICNEQIPEFPINYTDQIKKEIKTNLSEGLKVLLLYEANPIE